MSEMVSSLAVCIQFESAQDARKVLEDRGIWDSSRKLQRNGESVAVPVLGHDRSQLSTFLQDFPDAVVKELPLPLSAKNTRRTEWQILRDRVCNLLKKRNLFSHALLSEVPKKWERHGNLILLPSSAFASPQWDQLGDELWQVVASSLSCDRLARHSTVTSDGFRTPQVSMLLGDDGKVTHVDNGIKYSFDVTKCMFSSGNISEKLRVASWDCSHEVVVDLYAGIGYFTLPYLVHAKARHVHACEWNPHAVEALRSALLLNRVADRCTLHPGDNRQLQLSCVADRVNLGLIPSSEDGWCVATRVLKPEGGVLHIHHNVTTTCDTNSQQGDVEGVRHQNQQEQQNWEMTVKQKERHGDHFHFDTANCDDVLHNNDRAHDALNSSKCRSTHEENSRIEKSSDVVKECTYHLDKDNGSHAYSYSASCQHSSKMRVSEPHVLHTNGNCSGSGSYPCVIQNSGIEKKEYMGSQQERSCVESFRVQSSSPSCQRDENDERALEFSSDCIVIDADYVQMDRKQSRYLPWARGVCRRMERLLQEVKGGRGGWRCRILHIEKVKSYAPHIDHVVLDLSCKPREGRGC